MHLERCICAHIPTLHLKTKVIVMMHHREWKRPTASAPLFAAADPKAEIRLRGLPNEPTCEAGLVHPNRRTLVLFPKENAQVLCDSLLAEDPRPITLVVPDGSWRQASKVVRREPALTQAQCVTLPDLGPSRYKLRREPKPGGLSTFEAIARALKIIEGPKVYHQLETLFDLMVEQTLSMRGTGS